MFTLKNPSAEIVRTWVFGGLDQGREDLDLLFPYYYCLKFVEFWWKKTLTAWSQGEWISMIWVFLGLDQDRIDLCLWFSSSCFQVNNHIFFFEKKRFFCFISPKNIFQEAVSCKIFNCGLKNFRNKKNTLLIFKRLNQT